MIDCCFRSPYRDHRRQTVAAPALWLMLASLLPFAGLRAEMVTAAESEARTTPAPRPNIVLIMADDLGWSDIGCYGGEIRTPAIDSLAKSGLRFRQFYNNAVCGPTRASLLTGLYSQQTGHVGHRWNEPKDFSRCATVGELLQRAGYRTMMTGKWQGRDSACDRGFDRFFGPMCQSKISYFDEVVGNLYHLDRERWLVPDDFYLTDAINEYSLKFLKEAASQEKPFFLYVAHIAPHWPLHARPAEVDRARPLYQQADWKTLRERRFAAQQESGLFPAEMKLPEPPKGLVVSPDDPHLAWQQERMAVYAAQVEAIDRGAAQLLQAIDEAGIAENTLVMFLSDNGAAPDGGLRPSKSGFGFSRLAENEAVQKKQRRFRLDGVPVNGGSGPDLLPGGPDTFAGYGIAWATLSNTPLKSTKMSGYEGGIRTPLIVRWPAVMGTEPGFTDAAGHVMDLTATCLDVAGAEYPADLDGRQLIPMEGRSLLPVLRGEPWKGHEVLCWSVPRDQVVRMGSWKAIRPRTGGNWQLFDLEHDPVEATDLASRYPERVRKLAAEFAAWQQRVGNQ